MKMPARSFVAALSLPVMAACGMAPTATATGPRAGTAVDDVAAGAVDDAWFSAGAEESAFQPLLDLASAVEQRLDPRRQEATARCMRDRGFDYRTGSTIVSKAPRNAYAVLSAAEEQAGEYRRPSEEAPADPNAAYVSALPASKRRAWGVALLGTGQQRTTVQLPSGATYSFVAGSCASLAAEAAFGVGFQAAVLAVQNLAGIVVSTVRHAPVVVAAVAAWSGCVMDAGLGLVSDLSALRALALDPATDSATSRSAFDVDRTCVDQSNLRSILDQAQRTAERATAMQQPLPLIRLASQIAIDGRAGPD